MKHLDQTGESGEAHSVLGVEDVGGGRVVHYDDVTQLSAEATQVFDIVSSVEHTGFTKKSHPKYTPLVQQVSHRVSVLQNRRERSKVYKFNRVAGWCCNTKSCHIAISKNRANRTGSSASF